MSQATATYILGTSDAEIDHLVRQAEVYSPSAGDLLDDLGIQPGWRAIDVACGALGIVHLLAERVGPTGEVIGLDREPRMLDAARSLAAQRGLDNVRFVQADATATGLPRAGLDLVHTRTLLVNHPRPADVVREMVTLARPGGIVVAQEPDCSAWICEPGHPSWDALAAIFQDYYRLQGRDPYIGRRLREMFRNAGLVDVKATVRAGCVTETGDWYHALLPTFVGLLREQIVTQGICEVEELDMLLAEVHRHLGKPGTLTMVPLWQAWGRRR